MRSQLFALAAEQGGYFSAAQAKDVGYSYQAQSHHVQAGNWIRVDRALYRLDDWVPDVHDELARWTLWSHGVAVVSHETALAVHEIGEFESAKVQLTVPRAFAKRREAVSLHYADLPDGDVEAWAGFRVTTSVRSIVDVAASRPDEDQLSRAINDARERGLLTIRQLSLRAEAIDLGAALSIERALRSLETR